MKSRQAIMTAAIELLQIYPYDEITFADISNVTGDHWTTVKRYFESKENMRSILQKEQKLLENAAPATKSRLIEIGRHIFAQKGYEKTSLEEIAAEIGLSKTIIYSHFNNKNELYLSICEQSLNQLLKNIEQNLYSVFCSSHPPLAIKALIESELRRCDEQSGDSTKLFLQFISTNDNNELKQRLSKSFDHLFLETENVLKNLQKDNLINQSFDCNTVAIALHSFINGIVLMWLINPQSISFAKIAESVSNMLWSGLRPQEGGES